MKSKEALSSVLAVIVTSALAILFEKYIDIVAASIMVVVGTIMLMWINDLFKPVGVLLQRGRLLVYFAAIFAGLALISYIAWTLLFGIHVYAEFRPFYPQFEIALGKPTQNATPAGGAYESWHQHATVLWVYTRPGFIIMPIGSDQWLRADDVAGWDPRYGLDQFVKNMLKKTIPKGLYPPRGGLAALFADNFEYWNDEVGWRRLDCGLDGHSIHVQRFQHGWIVGGFIVGADTSNAKAYIVLDNGKRDSEPMEKGPPCIDVHH